MDVVTAHRNSNLKTLLSIGGWNPKVCCNDLRFTTVAKIKLYLELKLRIFLLLGSQPWFPLLPIVRPSSKVLSPSCITTIDGLDID